MKLNREALYWIARSAAGHPLDDHPGIGMANKSELVAVKLCALLAQSKDDEIVILTEEQFAEAIAAGQRSLMNDIVSA